MLPVNDTRRRPRSLSTLVLLLMLLVLGSGALAHAATIETDKEDYAPGDTVVMFGSGWEPFETVELLLQQSPGDWNDRVFITVADATSTRASS
jgi:hypothetical protein